jgi:hypothetical protein
MDIEINIYCEKCGSVLNTIEMKMTIYGADMYSEPCETCIEEAIEEGKEIGYADCEEGQNDE